MSKFLPIPYFPPTINHLFDKQGIDARLCDFLAQFAAITGGVVGRIAGKDKDNTAA
ncbi:MAG: hypothetical protein M5U34_09730 [Chloroflexi bacterium]|nr:hypothetical protein [Chloroflexota bacterium]